MKMQEPLPGSAHGGAALINPPTPGSGEWRGRESMSKAEPKGERLLKRLKKEIVRGGAAAVQVKLMGSPGGALERPEAGQSLSGSEMCGIVKIKPFLKDNLGFSSPGVLPEALEWLPRGAWGSTLAPFGSGGDP